MVLPAEGSAAARKTPADHADDRARDAPDELAVVDDRTTLTWVELARRSDSLAAGLVERVDLDGVVFEQLYNCVELYLLRLACEKAGVQLITAPGTFRGNELEPLFRQLEPSVAIVPGSYRGTDFVDLVDRVNAGSLETTVTLDGSGDVRFEDVVGEADDDRLRGRRFGPKDVAHLPLTSGSSGAPTCVNTPIETRVRTSAAHYRRFGIGGTDVVGVVTPLVSGAPDSLAYHGAPQAGTTVVLLDRLDVPALVDRLAGDLTVLPAVPTVTAKLVEHLRSGGRAGAGGRVEGRREGAEGTGEAGANGGGSSLDLLVNYGDVLAPSVARAVEDRLGCVVHQAFGATDYGGISCTEQGDGRAVRFDTVGRPYADNEVVLRTDGGELVDEPGVVGTLLVRGRHGATEAIVGEIDRHGRYCDVGVRARFDEEGHIVLLGREKDVIIRGGRNIYPPDVEQLINTSPDVAESAVIGVPSDEYGERVCAFVVPAEGATLAFEEVVEHLREANVAPFKVPDVGAVVADLPMVPAGHKVDRSALLELARRRGLV